MKKKLLFVISSLYGGGAERSLVNLLQKLDQAKYEIDLMLFYRGGLFMQMIPQNVRILEIPREIRFLNGYPDKQLMASFSFKCAVLRFGYILMRPKKCSAYKNNQVLWRRVWNKCVPRLDMEYDIAAAYMHSIPSYYVMDKVCAKRKVLWMHNDYSGLEGDAALDADYFEKADCIVTVSERCREALVGRFPHLEPKIKILYNINSAKIISEMATRFDPEEYAEAVDNREAILLSVGRLSHAKGFDLAVEAAAIMKESGLRFRWFIIGSGDLQKEMENQIDRLGLQKEFLLLGQRENPYPYMLQADLIVQPSRYEGKSIVLDEAKILHRPILAARYNSAEDQIKDGETGMLVEGSARAIAQGIQNFLNDYEKRVSLACNLSKFAWDTEKEVDGYMECLDGMENRA